MRREGRVGVTACEDKRGTRLGAAPGTRKVLIFRYYAAPESHRYMGRDIGT